MKRLLFSLVCLGLFLQPPLGALEIELTGGINFLTYHPERPIAHSHPDAKVSQFNGYPYGFGDFYLKNDISDVFGLSVHAARDNILRNSISGSLITNTEFFKIQMGAFFAMGDSLEIPNMGIIGGIEFMYPGIFFVSINGSSTLGSQFNFTSNSSRESFDVVAGFWLPNAIPMLSVSAKNYTDQSENFIAKYDELVRFQISTDIFAKNFPITFRADIGYEILKRSYRRGTSQDTDELHAVYVGFQSKYQMTKPLRIIAGFETPIYLRTIQPMQGPNIVLRLFKFNGGISYTFF